MIFEEKKVTLKNGKTAIFKTPEHEDAKKMQTACVEKCSHGVCNHRYIFKHRQVGEQILTCG